MSIEFSCQSCGKAVRAPDAAGGKRGKCPFCGVSVFIPSMASESDEIGLAPINEDFEMQQERLRRESIDYAASVDHDDAEKITTTSAASASQPQQSTDSSSDVENRHVMDVAVEVENYIKAMHNSDLKMAERVVSRLRRRPGQAEDYIQGLLVDQMGINIQGIPEPLIQGFLKMLLNQIKA